MSASANLTFSIEIEISVVGEVHNGRGVSLGRECEGELILLRPLVMGHGLEIARIAGLSILREIEKLYCITLYPAVPHLVLEPFRTSVEMVAGERLSVLSQDHFQYDQETVLNTVLMGHTTMWQVMQEREALYSKPDFTDEDGIRVAELEDKFAEMGGYTAESDAATLLSGLGIREQKHNLLMGHLPADKAGKAEEKSKILTIRRYTK